MTDDQGPKTPSDASNLSPMKVHLQNKYSVEATSADNNETSSFMKMAGVKTEIAPNNQSNKKWNNSKLSQGSNKDLNIVVKKVSRKPSPRQPNARKRVSN